MLNKVLLSSIFVILGISNAIGAGDSCIKVEPMDHFNPYGFAGNWYIIAMQDENDKNSDCKRALIYVRRYNNDLPVIRMWRDTNDKSTHMQLKNATMYKTGEGVSLDGYKLTIVGANYDYWVVVIACDESANRRVVWVLAREKNANFFQRFGAEAVLLRYGIWYYSLRSVNQYSCPDDWSDAEKDEVDLKYEDVKDELKKNNIIKG